MIEGETLTQLSGDERVILSRYARGDAPEFPLPAEGRIALGLWGRGLLCRIGQTLYITEAGREVLDRMM